MSASNEKLSELRAGYVVRVVLIALAITVLQFFTGAAVYYSLYGVPTFRDVTTVWVPDYSSAELWKGNVVFSVTRTAPGEPPNSNTLRSFDPENGEVKPIDLHFQFPVIGTIADEQNLKIVSKSGMINFDGEQADEIQVKRTLIQPTRPFLFDGRLAVIDLGTKGPPRLLVFQDDDWTVLGIVPIPFDFNVITVEGKQQLVRTTPTPGSKAVARLTTIEVMSHQGRCHLFVSNGSHVLYRPGIEPAPTSALSPENSDSSVDLSQLNEWEIACSLTTNALMRSKPSWKAGLVEGEPVLTAVSSPPLTNPFQAAQIGCYRRSDKSWNLIGEISATGVGELLTVTDGLKTYFAAYSLMGGLLRIHRIRKDDVVPTGAVIKAPEPGFVKVQIQAIRMLQWVYWPFLAFYVFVISVLIRKRNNVQYQFGATQVELASLTCRAFAAVVDFLIYLGASYAVSWSFGMMSQEEAEKNADKIFDFGPGGYMIRWLWMCLTLISCYLLILMVTSFFEGRWGLTLGKWIFGIRTRRTTLRPCGFLRAMLREIFILVDTICSFSCLPGTLTIAMTSNRQRLGDLVADTIVIRKPKPSDGVSS